MHAQAQCHLLTHVACPGAITDEADIGRILAKAVNDPRTLNRKVIIKGNVLTQNELISTYEGLANKAVSRKHVTREELDQQIKGASSLAAIVYMPMRSCNLSYSRALMQDSLR